MELWYPNKPNRDYKESLSRYEEEGCWRMSAKLDGYRCMVARDRSRKFGSAVLNDAVQPVGFDRSLYFFSRRDSKKGGPTPIPVKDEIIQTIEKWDLPDLSMLDGEWLARRTVGECPEKYFPFDILWWGDQWLGDMIFSDRDKILRDQYGNAVNKFVDMPNQVSNNFAAFFTKLETIPWTEGGVMKHVDSKIIGDKDKCLYNPLWASVKWRCGSSGREMVR